MAEFLDAFDAERNGLIEVMDHFGTVWDRFRERQTLEIGDDTASDSLIASELDLVREDLHKATFTIGVFGLIKRGKSTLLNSLIGREVSSMHVTPETAVPVYVSYSDESGATVHLVSGKSRTVDVDDVAQFTSQKHNPGNQLGVTHVEQQVPVPFLRNGTRLIDTPGLDDAAADDVYTERTLQELDVCDAGIVVFLSPPTVGATEMGFLEDIVSRDLKKTFLVCNMYPQHFHDPETRTSVLQYVGHRIVEASQRAGEFGEVKVYPVCAYEAWQARENDDIDMWKKSGADRLLRDLEGFLAEVAAKQVLADSVQRFNKAASMAQQEVNIRMQLLSDPAKLDAIRANIDGRVRSLESHLKTSLDRNLEPVEAMRQQVRMRMLQPFRQAANEIDELETAEDIEDYASTFKRRIEVAAEDAGRMFHEGFDIVVDKLRQDLESQFEAVVHDVAVDAHFDLDNTSLLVTPDQMQTMKSQMKKAKQTTTTTAALSGIGGGAVAFAVGGAMLLSPIGLVAGALAGWRLSSSMMERKRLEQAREQLHERVEEIAARLTKEFDGQVERTIDMVRSGVERRRRQFAADLYEQFDIVSALGNDPEILAKHRTETERFSQAFQACAKRAHRLVEQSVYA